MDGSVSVWSDEDYDKESIKLCIKKIQEEFGQQFSSSKSIIEQHTHTMTIHESESVSYTHLTLPTKRIV